MSEQYANNGKKHREEKRVSRFFWLVFGLLAICGVIFMVYYLSGGRNSRRETEVVKTANAVAGNVVEGKKLFGALCAGCHGKDARGRVCPDLTVSTFKYGRSRLDITKTITEGRSGGMPTFGGRIEKERIESLVEFVLSLK